MLKGYHLEQNALRVSVWEKRNGKKMMTEEEKIEKRKIWAAEHKERQRVKSFYKGMMQ